MASDPVPNVYSPVEDPQSERMKQLAEWTVAEHNKKEGTHLKFICILKCEVQMVNGVNHRFTLTAKDEKDYEARYMAVVLEQQWKHLTELLYFRQLFLAE